MENWRNAVKRKIVYINKSLCNGCGQCIPKCVEGALQVIDGKARIVKDIYCDGLGACLGHCPQGAITIVEREAEAFSQEEVHKYINKHASSVAHKLSVLPETLQKRVQWPVKIDLVSPNAAFFENANILFSADCAPVVLKNFHTLAEGKAVIIGCPKFNDAKSYASKLSEILKLNSVASITVFYMEVPCCTGLKWAVNKALEDCGKKVLTCEVEVKIGGETIEHKW
jgi:NAD-dependent dihydropyrimidine dehydrogenase PreA subunit